MRADALAYRIDALTRRYRADQPPANDGISLEIPQGQVLGVFGPNGAGKTTLVRQMIGLLKPTSGRIELFGGSVVDRPDRVPHLVAYYGQQAVALRHHTVEEVLVLAGVLRGMAPGAARRQARELLERFDLAPLSRRLLARLSGGQHRLAVLLATFVGAAPVLVLDEPTNELDPVMRRRVWDYLTEINQHLGTTIILTTHHLTEAEHAVGRVAIIDRGRLVALGSPGALKRHVSDQVRLEVRLREHRLVPAEAALDRLGCARRRRPGLWEVVTPASGAAALLPQVMEAVGLDAIDDFRVSTPTLEDVYCHFTGRRWEEDHGTAGA